MKGRHFFYIYLILCIFTCIPCQSQSDKNRFVVVIDPGHGGHDGGAPGLSIKEKAINLSVSLKLGKLIDQNFEDVKVVYTRKTDVAVELSQRAVVANQAKADLFISIHTNSLEKRNKKRTTVSGASTYTLGLHNSEENLEVAKRENSVILLEDNYATRYEGFDPNSVESYIIFELIQGKHLEQSVNFASMIQKEFKQTASRKDMGVRQAGLLVLRETGMPGVLVELDFICNPTEEKFLASDAGQQKLARSIYNAFVDYKTDFDRKQHTGRVSKKTPAKIYTESTESADATVNTSSDDIPAPLNRNTSSEAPEKPSSQVSQKSEKKITYKIQFYISTRKLNPNSAKLKGLSPVSYYEENGSFKYMYEEYTSFKEATRQQNKLKRQFKDAFIIRFEDGIKVSN